MSFNGALAKSKLVFFLAVSAAACGRDSATDPGSPDARLTLEAVSATQIEGTVGEPVNTVPTVLVKSEDGRPVRGMKVTFVSLDSWGGRGDNVTNRIAMTDSRGVASAGSWTLGTVAGGHRLEASILGASISDPDHSTDRVIAFHAEAKAAAPALISKYDGDNRVGLPGDKIDHPSVWVTDRYGNYSREAAITFTVTSGGGSLVLSKDAQRSPSTWTLGPNPGLNSVVATAAGLNSVTFNAQALDIGAATSYDMKPGSVRLIESGSIALGENGLFRMLFVEGSDALPGSWRTIVFGKYTLTGTRIVLTYPAGLIEEGTLINDSLSVLRTKENWHGEPPQMWTFVKRD